MSSVSKLLLALKGKQQLAGAPVRDSEYTEKLASALEYVAETGTFDIPSMPIHVDLSVTEKVANARVATGSLEKALLDKIAQKRVAQDDGLRKEAAAALVSRLVFEKLARANTQAAAVQQDAEPAFEYTEDAEEFAAKLSQHNIGATNRAGEAVKIAAAIPSVTVNELIQTAMAAGAQPAVQDVTAASANAPQGVKTASARGKVGPMAIADTKAALCAALRQRTAG